MVRGLRDESVKLRADAERETRRADRMQARGAPSSLSTHKYLEISANICKYLQISENILKIYEQKSAHPNTRATIVLAFLPYHI